MDHRLEALDHQLGGDTGNHVHQHHQRDAQRHTQRTGGNKEDDDVQHRCNQLHARVHLMNEGMSREILPNGNISQHT